MASAASAPAMLEVGLEAAEVALLAVVPGVFFPTDNLVAPSMAKNVGL